MTTTYLERPSLAQAPPQLRNAHLRRRQCRRLSHREREILWRAGGAFYVPTWDWHQHSNVSSTESALYVACENAPMLQNLGIALREEA